MDHPIVVGSAGGEYMETVVVLEWTRAPGERIEAGETIVVIETAKAATEIEASHAGTLKEILVKAAEEVPVGALLGRISDDVSVPMPEQAVASTVVEQGPRPAVPPPVSPDPAHKRVVASPLARRIARDRGLDLFGLAGTGPGGLVKRRDVDAATAACVPRPAPLSQAARDARPVATPPPVAPRDDAVPIVFLHGFGADRSAWRQVTPLLPHRRVILLDLPGHGEAPAVAARSIDDLAFAVSDRLTAMGIEEAHMVGHSLGGATALALTELGPLRVRSLCLIAPGGLGPEIDMGFLMGFVAATQPDDLEPWLARMVADPSRLPTGLARAVLRQRAKAGTAAAQRDLLTALFPDGIQGMALRSVLDAVTVPAKVIWGLEDAIIPPRHASAARGGVALHLLRDIGHVPQMECPALVARLIDELVRSSG